MISIRWFLPQFWKDRNENTRQKLDHENEVMAYERRRWQRWVKRMRRRQKSCRSDCEPSEEGCSCCDSCRLPNIIRWAAPILRMVPHVASPGAARIGASKNPSLFELNALCAVSPVQYRSGMNVYWFHVILWCEENLFLYLKRILKIIFLKRYCTSSFCMFCIKEFFII